MASTQHVLVRKIVSVYPKTLQPQNDQNLNLSNLDRQCPMLMYLVFFYKSASSNLYSVDSVFSNLKSSLEETLSVWYPAAGRLSLNPNDGKLNLSCNNDGAVLVEAVTHVKISHLGDLSQYNEFFENLVYKPVFNGNFSHMPLVVAQVTKFDCGGYSVGIGASHSLFDGPATYDFLRAWASNSQKGGFDQLLQKPVHGRGRIGVSNPNKVSVARAAAIDHLYLLIKQAISDQNRAGLDGKLGAEMMGSSNYVLKTFHLTGKMIENFKKKLFGSNFSCSSFELVAAHLWKARTKALRLSKESMVCLQFAVDTRNKMVPPLPKGFSGNAYVLASVALTAGELEEANYEEIIEKIKEAKHSINNEYVNAYIEALEGARNITLPPLELTLVSDWTRMPFHKVDFVCGEEAVYVTPLVSPIPQVALLMQNPSDPMCIDVRIGLLSQSLNAFSQYFLTDV